MSGHLRIARCLPAVEIRPEIVAHSQEVPGARPFEELRLLVASNDQIQYDMARGVDSTYQNPCPVTTEQYGQISPLKITQ